MDQDQDKKGLKEAEFFTEYEEAFRYNNLKIVGKGTYGVVSAATDTHTGEKVAIKKITNVFESTSGALRVLREVKLLRLLRHPNIVQVKRIMLPPSRLEFRDIYVVFELMDCNLRQIIDVNDDLTHDHHRLFLYRMLRGLNYMHKANVYHRDLKATNILVNADNTLKICDLGLARVASNDAPSTIVYTDYIATRWYRAPELCAPLYSRYTSAIDIWSIGCIFAEILTGRPLFPGNDDIDQLRLMTDLLGKPSLETISGVRDEDKRNYLKKMQKKKPARLSERIPNADPLALNLLQRLLAFDPKDRINAEQALADPYFEGFSSAEEKPPSQPFSKLEFEFELQQLTIKEVRQLIFREILEYHPRRRLSYLEEKNEKSCSGIPPEKTNVSHPSETSTEGDRYKNKKRSRRKNN